MKDPYETLGVDRDASVEDIKRAHRKKALQHHPDRGGDVEAFREIQAAAELLGDDDRRRRYDETGETDTGRTVDRAEQEIAAMVAEAFCREGDPIAWMESVIDQERQEHKKQLVRIEMAIKKMTKTLDKFKAREAKKNKAGKALIIEAAEANITAARRDLAATEAAIKPRANAWTFRVQYE